MTAHRFTVNVPNPTAKSAAVQLRLEQTKPTGLPWLRRDGKKGELKVVSAGIAHELCAADGQAVMKLKLAPYASTDVHVIISTDASSQPGAAAFNLIDQRGGKDVGGVLLVCVDPPVAEPAGQVVPTPKPCPATLAGDLYAIVPGEDPSRAPAGKSIPSGGSLELVAPITNPTSRGLKDTTVYLEHLGESNAEFSPGTWNVGSLGKGDVFYATWQIRTSSWQVGSFNACVVVASEGKDPVRLNGTIHLAPEPVGKRR